MIDEFKRIVKEIDPGLKIRKVRGAYLTYEVKRDDVCLVLQAAAIREGTPQDLEDDAAAEHGIASAGWFVYVNLRSSGAVLPPDDGILLPDDHEAVIHGRTLRYAERVTRLSEFLYRHLADSIPEATYTFRGGQFIHNLTGEPARTLEEVEDFELEEDPTETHPAPPTGISSRFDRILAAAEDDG